MNQTQRILLAQEQLNLLQQYGVYGYEMLKELSLMMYNKVGERTTGFVDEYKNGKKVEWTEITESISNYIREMHGKESSVMIKEV